ncbi:MAG: hypothetical protein MRZ79_20750, partial [Bacteroidia bacterium]|nr:hypothetical protein [Bacteroidia bacterium]
MSKNLFIVILIAFIGALSSCDINRNPLSEGTLEFSSDTLNFDSLFVNFLSPTEILVTYNNSGHPINVDRIWLENGEESEFEMIADGIKS